MRSAAASTSAGAGGSIARTTVVTGKVDTAGLGGHFGIIGMRERAERLGGELSLHSRPGEGTEVEVTVPLP